MRIAIIGAGVAGLTCARFLKDAGITPVVIDKGRGLGGRLATRRAGSTLQFDHGAQFASARSAEFAAFMKGAVAAGSAALWDDGSGRDHYVGTPGMSGLAKYLARDLSVRQRMQVSGIEDTGDGWRITFDQGAEVYDTVVCTAPAPQTMALLGPDHPVSMDIRGVAYHPCLTLMVALKSQGPDAVVIRDSDANLDWIARDSSKPMRSGQGCWVAHGSPDWSNQHLEETKDAIRERMLPLFLERLGLTDADILHADAHRWRYARVSSPFGAPFAKSDDGKFYAGGDWCLAPRVEAAWQSGHAIAQDILSREKPRRS